MKVLKYGLAALLSTGALYAGNYKVDADHSHVEFKVKHLMISNVKGNFGKFDGTYEYDEKAKVLKSLTGTVEVASINTDNEKRDEHLRAEDFFAAAKYPVISFKLTKVDGDKAYGDLTMRGVTKAVVLEIETSDAITDPWGNTRTAIALNGTINRYDFGLKYNSVLEAGGVAVGEEVKLSVELEGILEK